MNNNFDDSGQATGYSMPPPPEELYQDQAIEITNMTQQTKAQNECHGGETGFWDRASASGRNSGKRSVTSPTDANNPVQASNKHAFLNSTSHTQGDSGFHSFNASGNSPFVKGYTSPFPSRRESRNHRYSPYQTKTSPKNPLIPLTAVLPILQLTVFKCKTSLC